MTLVRAAIYKAFNPYFSWDHCKYVAKDDMKNIPPPNWTHLIYGICAVAAAVLVVAPWLTRAGCGV